MEEGRNFFESEDNDEDINMIEENQSINIENINEEESIEDSVNENFLYNENEFKKDKVINFFRDTHLINKTNICNRCGSEMKLVKDKTRIDGLIWRCAKRGINRHDNRINLRKGSIFEKIKVDIRMLYFLIFYNFIENKSVKLSYINSKEFAKQLKLDYITKKSVSKFFKILHKKIKTKMQKTWKETMLGMEPCQNGKSYCEIDESKIINYNNETRWMFGIYDRGSKDIRIFYVDNNRTQETLMPIIKNNIYTVYDSINNNEDPNDELYPTRIFSDYFQTYQISEFNSLGFKLHKVNHSVWFGQGHFHTNSIEGTWSRIKRLCRSFNGLNGNIFNTNRNLNDKDYFEGWICTGIFFMKCESQHLALNEKKNYLIEFLKI